MKNLTLLIIAILSITACKRDKIPPDSATLLWFEHPATIWEEATPLGNGRIGAMDYGQIQKQVIQLNEESLWAGAPQGNLPDDAAYHMEQFRQMLLKNEYQTAYEYGMENLTFSPTSFRSYQTLGNLTLDFNLPDSVADYQRILDIETGIETTRFKIDGLTITKKLLISAVDDILQLEITASKKHVLNLLVNLDRDLDASIYFPDDQTILMDGQIIDVPAPDAYDDNPGGSGPGGEHMRFAARVKVLQEGGSATAHPSGIQISSANKVIIRLTAATDFDVRTLNFNRQINPLELTEEILTKAADKSATQLRNDHIREHKALFKQLDLDLGPTTAPGLSTFERLNRVIEGATDPLLDAQYYQFGRYLLMSSSRPPGRLPANLQGIWNPHMWAPWEADYHQNINLQMNYWPGLSGNLEECFKSLDNFLVPTYELSKRNARELYNSDGWVSHTATSLFGRTTPSGSTKSSQMINGYGFPLAGAWMSLYMYRYFEYTLDTVYLKTIAYPTMKGAAEFILDYLVEHPSGFMVSVPSSSPENNFIDPQTGKGQRLTYGSTMDCQIIREVLSKVIQSAEILGEDQPFAKELKSIVSSLPPTRIGANGTIMEWIEDYDEAEPGHRHMSHLFGLHPTFQITPDQTPELAEAARKTLERRLSFGGGHTGWSRAWLINFYARLWDGESAYDHLQMLFRKSTRPNLFDNHPPFQIDGNFGGAAGIAEMLVQSRSDMIILLPALPEAWATGHIKGIKVHGNVEIEMNWEDGKLIKAGFSSPTPQILSVSYGGKVYEIHLVANKVTVFNP